jgi:hypothetical protein
VKIIVEIGNFSLISPKAVVVVLINFVNKKDRRLMKIQVDRFVVGIKPIKG